MSQSEIKYNRLIEKAEELFIELGYKSVSMDQIAEAAGISKMTIYKYFSSKEELFLNILQSIGDRSFIYIEDQMKKIDGTIEKIDFLLHFNVEYSKQFSLTFYKDIMDNPYIIDRLMKEKKRMSKIIFEDIIRNGVERGEIRDVDEAFMANMLITLIDSISKNFFEKITCRKELEDFTENFYDFLKYGLLGGKGAK
ncbi:TetR/AcrR family transcriptional regulator [Alkaliphilus sp. MSJ-5]|uniref:TetR/AcrR family transcriptional regulator n=1 Tax=Alkaliphilus flagellatus TaxID=2841507 RepID=A0ABS6G4I1_9FIRM|nr:TetR/AcrR family transcriptional regulator [Alkaliphilus flagellatus]